MPTAPIIRWDVVEEHLDEAAFLRAQWERALADPEYTLEEVRDGPEERMLAHLDGLVVAGRRAADRLLVPALAGDDGDVAFAAAFALLASEDGDFTDPVLRALGDGEPAVAEAVLRALQLAPRPDLGTRLALVLAKGAPLAQSYALRALAFRRIDPGVRLDPLAGSKDAALRRAVLRVARVFPERVPPGTVERALASDDAEERALAIEVGLVLGVKAAWTACERAARDAGPGWGRAAIGWALSGERDLGPLDAGLADPARRRDALFALGFTGRAAAAEAALGWIGDGQAGRVAAETISAVTGLAIEGRHAAPPERWDPDAPGDDEGEDEDGDGPDPELPAPDPEAVAAWWAAERPRFDPAQRWLGGSAWTMEGVVAALEAGPCRRRAALALDLAVRSRGAHQLEWTATARRQLAELAEIRRAIPRAAGTWREIVQVPPPRLTAPRPA
jgi:uncharacterized protein (TIGR02270 family)